MDEEYTVDPVKDLVPVCPNCHAVIDLSRPPLSVAAVREMLRRGHDPATYAELARTSAVRAKLVEFGIVRATPPVKRKGLRRKGR